MATGGPPMATGGLPWVVSTGELFFLKMNKNKFYFENDRKNNTIKLMPFWRYQGPDVDALQLLKMYQWLDEDDN